MEAVRDYSVVDKVVCAVVLQVDCDNITTAQPYKREGFEQYSGDDADDELYNNASSELSPPIQRIIARRGSMSNTNDAFDLW